MTWIPEIPDFPFDSAKVWKVVASAGCGKSFENKRAILDLIKKRGVDPEKIMYCIFNKLPADEFVDELRMEGVPEEKIRWMGTHHSICRKLLGVKEILTGKKLIDWGKEHGFEFVKTDEDGEDGFWEDIMRSMSTKIYNGDENFDPYERKLYSALLEEEAKTNRFTHIRYLQAALALRRLPSSIEYVFVDEAQDNGKIQFDYFEYLKSLPQIKGMMIVGDDKQAINRFKGGRWDLFADFKADKYVCLGKTYRNSLKILNFANQIISPVKDRSPLTTETNVENQGILTYYKYFEDSICDLKNELLQKRGVYILSRNKIFIQIARRILANYGIPVKSKKTESILSVFRAMRNLAIKDLFTLDDLWPILPFEESLPGQLKRTAYWKRGVLTKFMKGDYSVETEPNEKIEYENLRWGMENVDLETFDFSPKFMQDIKDTLKNKIPRDVFAGTSNNEITALENNVKLYGLEMGFVQPSHIHPIKGGEEDTVVLLRNITRSVADTEDLYPDEERRVWYVAATRARTKIIVTELYERSGHCTKFI